MDLISSKYRASKPRLTKKSRRSSANNLMKARAAKIYNREKLASSLCTPSTDAPSTSRKRPAAGSLSPELTREDSKLSVLEYSARNASEKKLSMFDDMHLLLSRDEAETQYIIFQRKKLENTFRHLECPNCRRGLSLKFQDKQGFCHLLKIECESCVKTICETFTSTRVVCEDSTRPPFQVNRHMAEAFSPFGLGHAAMETFCETMGMPCMTVWTFQQHLYALSEDLHKFKAQVLAESRRLVREAYEMEDESLKFQDVINIDVSYVGSWQKKGHTSLYGVGFIIDFKTGLVVDYDSLYKYCHACVQAEKSYGNKSKKFVKWYEDHMQSCNRNYESSSHAMAISIASMLWKRSVANSKMRYTTVLSDGDSKTCIHLNEIDPYGGVQIRTEEYINHVSKRLSSALKNLVSEYKVNKITAGGTSAGALTEHVIMKLAGYYRKAMSENRGSIEAMKTAILASPFHCASTDAKPLHGYCPEGINSWCFYKRAEAMERKPMSHSEMPLKLNENVFNHIQPIYQRLTDEALLERCSNGGTLNANESLHSILWSKCPKDNLVSKRRLDMSLLYATFHFNMEKYSSLLMYKTSHGEVLSTAER